MWPRLFTAFCVVGLALALASNAVAAGADDRSGHRLLAHLSLKDAVSIAENATKGLAFQAVAEVEDGAPVYDIRLLTDAGKVETRIDASTGAVRSVSSQGWFARIYNQAASILWGGEDDVSWVPSSGLDLASAIVAAERSTGGHAVSAAIEGSGANMPLDILVDVARDDGTDTATRIDTRSGAVVSTVPDTGSSSQH